MLFGIYAGINQIFRRQQLLLPNLVLLVVKKGLSLHPQSGQLTVNKKSLMIQREGRSQLRKPPNGNVPSQEKVWLACFARRPCSKNTLYATYVNNIMPWIEFMGFSKHSFEAGCALGWAGTLLAVKHIVRNTGFLMDRGAMLS